MKNLYWASALLLTLGAAGEARAEISFTPRLFLYFDNNAQRESGLGQVAENVEEMRNQEFTDLLDETFGPGSSVTISESDGATRSNQIIFPMYGATLGVTLGADDATQLSLTALYGEADSDIASITTAKQTVSIAGFTAEDLIVSNTTGLAEYERIDIEATAQHRLNETFSLIGGLRYERLEQRGTFNNSFSVTNNASNLINLLLDGSDIDLGVTSEPGQGTSRAVGETYSIRGGVAAFIPVAQRQIVYVNGLLHLNYSPSETSRGRNTIPGIDFDEPVTVKVQSETAIGPDISVGYLHRFTDNVGLDVRYRGIFYFPVSGSRDFDDPRVNHGLNLGLTFWF